MMIQIGDLIGLISGLTALVAVFAFIYKRGQREGALTATVNGLKDIVPQMLMVQRDLASICQQLREHTCDLSWGTERFEQIGRELSSIKERITWLESKVNGKPS